MPRDYTDHPCFIALLTFLILITGRVVVADSLETDKQILLNLKAFLEEGNRVNQGRYTEWNPQDSSPCMWPGISCNIDSSRVTGIDLSGNDITGKIFGNFSALTELTYLDLSENTVGGEIPADLGHCHSLRFLNLSQNIIDGQINLTGLNSLEVLDLSVNRIRAEIRLAFPGICNSLVVANISSNSFTGEIGNALDECLNLQYVDLSMNNLSGDLLFGLGRLREFLVSENKLRGTVPSWIFTGNCSLQVLDLSANYFYGEFPNGISNCKDLVIFNLWRNNFTGQIPQELGSVSSLQGLFLGDNNFSREIPESLLRLRTLAYLDLRRNNFGGDIQDIFGRFTQVKFLVLQGNSYTGGLYSSGILMLPNVSRLDLSYNNFSGPLPVEISHMLSLKFLVLAYSQFTGNIPPEYGNLLELQALDLSFNRLNGSIPASFGKLSSLLWLMLTNNSLTGEIPRELGNCSSLLWLNVANNQLSGSIPPELTDIGKNATATFQLNRQNDRIIAGSGECLAMMRWIPADYPPFSFMYTLLSRKSCRSQWDRLLKGYGLFPLCVPGSSIRTLQISGYVQLSGNQLSGEIPPEIGKMQNFSILHLGANELSGTLPPEIGLLPIIVLNISQNKFSGEIPTQFGNIKCLQNLDLSYNNFSGTFPTSLNNLTELSKFNVSYNPYISGQIPPTGQLATFEKWSFVGDPLLRLPSFIDTSIDSSPTDNSPADDEEPKKSTKLGAFSFSFIISFSIFFCLSFLVGLKYVNFNSSYRKRRRVS